MKAKLKLSGLRTRVVFAVVVLFVFFSACKKPDPVPPVIPEPKLPIVNEYNLIKISPTSINVGTELISEGDEVVTDYGLCWSTNATPTLKDSFLSAGCQCAVTFYVPNLQPHTTYYFRAYAAYKNGTVYSQTLSFLDPFVKATLIIKPATKITLTSATLAAVLIPGQDDTQANFEYREELASDWKSYPLTLTLGGNLNLKDSLKLSYDLSGLKANTAYRFRIKADNTAGETISDESKFLTCAVADFDGNFYHALEIGGQTWLQENLRTTRYANGYAIVNVKDPANWEPLISGVYACYNNDLELGKTAGALYNFYVGVSSRGLISGYHVPTYEEWKTLADYLKSSQTGQATALPIMETGPTHWLNLNQSFIATNLTGFTALPNGEINLDAKTNAFVFAELGLSANFWSSSLSGTGANYARIDGGDCVLNPEGIIEQNRGLGIRLIKDK